jgi:hypothetical protein
MFHYEPCQKKVGFSKCWVLCFFLFLLPPSLSEVIGDALVKCHSSPNQSGWFCRKGEESSIEERRFSESLNVVRMKSYKEARRAKRINRKISIAAYKLLKGITSPSAENKPKIDRPRPPWQPQPRKEVNKNYLGKVHCILDPNHRPWAAITKNLL